MIEAYVIIILLLLGCIGLGVLLGWCIWGYDAKYYKNLAVAYKDKLTSSEVEEVEYETYDDYYD